MSRIRRCFPLIPVILSATSILALLPPASQAEDLTDEVADRRLCQGVAHNPIPLAEAVARAQARGRLALAATFEIDARGALGIAVTTVGAGPEAGDFQRAAGPVTATGWSPSVQPLTEPGEVAEAARWQLLLSQSDVSLSDALSAMAAPPQGGTSSLPAFPLSLRPRVRDRRPRIEGRAAVDGLPWTVQVDLGSGQIMLMEPPPYEKARREQARRREGKTLPEIAVPGGRWLNVAAPQTLAAWKGHPVLVVLTNFACELECGPSPDRISLWNERYGRRGLRVVTIYRDREEWKPRFTVEDMIAKVKAAGLAHPVLLDLEDVYLRGLEPGPVGYPVAYVVGADGVVAWESATGRTGFEERCERAIEASLSPAADPRQQPSGPR